MNAPHVILPPLAAPVNQLWHLLLDLSERLSAPWTLIGGQMVLLHALEHGQVPPQISQDGDVVADVRASPWAVRDVVAALAYAGFAAASLSTDGLAHRYERPAEPRPVVVDVLAPEGLPGDSPLLRTTPPGRTVEVPGGTQALTRTEHVDVTHEGRDGTLPRPLLLAAIVLKAAAVNLGPDPSRHFRDLALLCALVEDPFEMRESLTAKDRQRLRQGRALHQATHPAGPWYQPTFANEDRPPSRCSARASRVELHTAPSAGAGRGAGTGGERTSVTSWALRCRKRIERSPARVPVDLGRKASQINKLVKAE